MAELEAKLNTSVQKIEALDAKLKQADMIIESKSQTEEKLRQQLVEVAENQQISANELEANLNNKIRQLDEQNDKCWQEIATLKNGNTVLLASNDKLNQELEAWKVKEQTARNAVKGQEQKVSQLEQLMDHLEQSKKVLQAEKEQSVSSLQQELQKAK